MQRFDRQGMTDFVETYAGAVAAGDLPGIAACCAVPALVLGPGTSIPFQTREDVEATCRGAAEGHRARGLVSARPTVHSAEPLGPDLIVTDVDWAYLDNAGIAKEGSAYRYVVRRQPENSLGIQVVIVHGPA